MMKQVAVTQLEYLFAEKFDEGLFAHPEARLMDRYTKMAISVARTLHIRARGKELTPHQLGIVFSTHTGPLESIREYTDVLKEKGYFGINPSKFPNIMSATPLSRVATEIGARGPCLPVLSVKSIKHAYNYAALQIAMGRCDAVILVHLTEGKACFGCFLEDKESCLRRDVKPRFDLFMDI